jgi:hypothetical protein
MAQDWRVHAVVYFCSAGSDLSVAVLYRPLDMESTDMTKLDALRIFKLLSALESWAYSTKNPLPDFIDNDLVTAMAILENLILKGEA